MSTKKTGWEELDKWVGGSGTGGTLSGDTGKDVGHWTAEERVGEAVVTAPKTGWEALDKWVSSDSSDAKVLATGTGKTGWEALEKWIDPSQISDDAATLKEGDAAALSGGGKKTGWEALDHWVAADGESRGSATEVVGEAVQAPVKASSGFFGWLKGLFGGK